MVQIKHCLLLAALCACTLGDTKKKSEAPETIPVPHQEDVPAPVISTQSPETTVSSTSPPTTKPTTTAPTTTPPTTTKATTTPPTTTPPTTTPPTTTPPTTTPPTTTTAPPSPTPAPEPLPAPEQGKWSYTNKTDNDTCIMVNFAAQLNITYYKVVNQSNDLAWQRFNVPANATVSGGRCGPSEQSITVSWPAPGANSTNNLTLIFHSNATTSSYGLQHIVLEMSPANFINSSSATAVVLHAGAAWQTPLATSYRCARAAALQLEAASAADGAGTLTFSAAQEQAFRNATSKDFSAARDCGGADVPDAVPIAVGCALGGLVVVVLVAYLVGRRRSAARGYLSM